MPQGTLPDSLRSVLAAAGIGAARTDEPVVPDPQPGADLGSDAPLDPILGENPDPDLPPDPVLADTAEPDPQPEPALAEPPEPASSEDADEPVRLDPTRAAQPGSNNHAGTGAAPVRPRGPVASFAVHAVVLLAFFDWPAAVPVEVTQPIPVALVIEQPPPTAPEKAQAQATPPPEGRLASDDMGDPAAHDSGTGAPAPAEVTKPDPAPPPPPTPQDKPETAEPKPAKERLAMIPPPPPKPTPPARPQPKPEATLAAPPHPQDTPHLAPHAARFPGPSATRDEYLAYLLTLTRQHLDLLPRSAVGDREGETIVTILVLDDGTIARINVAQSSGYPDLDHRVEQMVAAVGHFPPLPQWYQGPRVELNLRLRFPEALQE